MAFGASSAEDALNCISKEGATCHAKVGCDDGRLVVGLKWGGELTEAGINDAEELNPIDFYKKKECRLHIEPSWLLD